MCDFAKDTRLSSSQAGSDPICLMSHSLQCASSREGELSDSFLPFLFPSLLFLPSRGNWSLQRWGDVWKVLGLFWGAETGQGADWMAAWRMVGESRLSGRFLSWGQAQRWAAFMGKDVVGRKRREGWGQNISRITCRGVLRHLDIWF